MRYSNEKTDRFMEMVERNKRIICKVCYMYSSDNEHFKDLYQEVIANVWAGLDRFKGDSRESTWIYRVAINSCITDFRRNDRHNHSLELDRAASLADDSGPDAERSLMLGQMYEMIGALGKIDKAIMMLWLDEFSYDEIATLTGLSRNNVASRLLRARRLLVKRSNE